MYLSLRVLVQRRMDTYLSPEMSGAKTIITKQNRQLKSRFRVDRVNPAAARQTRKNFWRPPGRLQSDFGAAIETLECFWRLHFDSRVYLGQSYSSVLENKTLPPANSCRFRPSHQPIVAGSDPPTSQQLPIQTVPPAKSCRFRLSASQQLPIQTFLQPTVAGPDPPGGQQLPTNF
ncbi:hypothetical protein PoB_001434800 [Plakobranchus ocellatus]|uniref:Uncharacterized protein n=1 Tax=Plakobranchus ocellatus TaxID=259542 RepID=A0AAV3YZ94_9GAST|nr:hypothetical protein PoB_001434800 [Plakobranchus ocellatus]